MSNKEAVCNLRFRLVPGFFTNLTERAQQDPTAKLTTLPSLGLLDKSAWPDNVAEATSNEGKASWELLADHVAHLNSESPGSTKYKVLFITRHGQGYHNTFEAKSHWSHLDGDGTVVWADAKIDENGIKQAADLSEIWSKTATEDKLPLPKSIYTSPLARCLETTRRVLSKTYQEQGAEFRPIIKELLRERLTDHTCDRRSSRSWIEANYPDYLFESGFSEEDKLWTGKVWETTAEHVARKQQVLEDIFATDDNGFVALVTHSYAISAILGVLGEEEVRVREGSTIMLFVKAEQVHHVLEEATTLYPRTSC
ncbi:histidine phosphatase superfamily [Plectosphaerella cucumerina]|uniref:Histidine phosphatase superfamily n=1 Tax=Plectosphaerella cucumerina TaxID=40658 RepID=A0A8K0TC72_9PEZI|nr:histidine phosphatase superfamily [Plectosphaerella cucumerina]